MALEKKEVEAAQILALGLVGRPFLHIPIFPYIMFIYMVCINIYIYLSIYISVPNAKQHPQVTVYNPALAHQSCSEAAGRSNSD